MGMSPFRRGVQSETKKPAFPKGRKSFFEKFRIPQGTPTPFVIVAGEYIDSNPPAEQIEIDAMTGQAKPVKNAYRKVTKHKKKGFRNGKDYYAETICSAGNDPRNPQPCAGCMAMDSGDATVTKSDQFAFTIVHLNPYHSHPLVGKEGQIVLKKDGSGPVMIETECSGKKCDFCRVLKGEPATGEDWPGFNANQISTTFGKRRYIELGKGHLSNLAGWDNTVRSACGGCDSLLDLNGYSCSTCGTMNIDAGSDPRSDLELEEAVSRPYPCSTCQRHTMHSEVVSCATCTEQGKTAIQNSLFGVVLWGSRQGEGTKSQLTLARFETPEKYNSKVPKALLGGKTVQQIVAEIGKPYDFDEVFTPESVTDQAQRLELQGASHKPDYGNTGNPFGVSSFRPQPQFAPYPSAQGAPSPLPIPPLPNFGK